MLLNVTGYTFHTIQQAVILIMHGLETVLNREVNIILSAHFIQGAQGTIICAEFNTKVAQ